MSPVAPPGGSGVPPLPAVPELPSLEPSFRTVIAPAPLSPGERGSASHNPFPVQPSTAPSLLRDRHVQNIALPWVRARGEGKGKCQARAFHKPMRKRAVCAKRLAKGKAIALPWVRARGRARQNGLRTAQGQGHCCSAGVEPSAPRQRRSQWSAIAPCASPRPLANGTANGPQSLCVQTVLQCAPPCAHPRKGNGFAIGQALRTNRAVGKWHGKDESPSAPPFTPTGL